MASLDKRSYDMDETPELNLRANSPEMERALLEVLGNDREQIERGALSLLQREDQKGLAMRDGIDLQKQVRKTLLPLFTEDSAMAFELGTDTARRMEDIERNLQAYEMMNPYWHAEDLGATH